MLLSRNFAPSGQLAPYIRRHYVFSAELPDDYVIEDQLIAENSFIRVLLRGDWSAETRPGEWTSAGPIVLFGSNSRPLPVRVRGAFTVVGLAFRPSGWRSVFSQPASAFADGMFPLSAAWGEEAAQAMFDAVRTAPDDEAKVTAIEDAITQQINRVGHPFVDEEMGRFEMIARTDSTARIEEVARELGMSVRQMERRCLQAFGLTPKTILRRSRFLDMAEALRGFSTPGEEELAALRYFDQSHLTREFRRFTGMTPGKFAKANTPLFTAGLKLRVEGKAIP